MNDSFTEDANDYLKCLFDVAIQAAQPDARLLQELEILDFEQFSNIKIVALGKAAYQMAQIVSDHLAGKDFYGILIVPNGQTRCPSNFTLYNASHPVPDHSSVEAAKAALALVQSAGPNDLVLFLISGGGSALMASPAGSLTLDAKIDINRKLLSAGVPIADMNTVRKQLSLVKGGRLARAAYPATTVTFAISDIPGDDIGMIASGPSIPDTSTPQEALSILKRYLKEVPPDIEHHLQNSASEFEASERGSRANPESAKVITSSEIVLEAVASSVEADGLKAHILSSAFEGDSRDLAAFLSAIVLQVKHHKTPFSTPCLLLSGGETTVNVKGSGRGGRNVEFLLALALKLNGVEGVHALAADTDGVDGMEEIAGAVIGPSTLADALSLGLDASEFLENNDAHSFFERLGSSVVTGPTGTNVNDFRAILIT